MINQWLMMVKLVNWGYTLVKNGNHARSWRLFPVCQRAPPQRSTKRGSCSLQLPCWESLVLSSVDLRFEDL